MMILQLTAIEIQLIEEKASIVMPDGGKIAQILLFRQHDSHQIQSWMCVVGSRSSSVEGQVKHWEW